LHNNDFRKDNIDVVLKDFIDNYIRITENKLPLSIILAGGASVLLNFNMGMHLTELAEKLVKK